jgi:hypothetical protein
MAEAEPVPVVIDPTAAAMSELVRAQTAEAAVAQLASIRRTVSSTRDREGRIKRAKFVAAVLAMRMEGFSPQESAKILGVSFGQVTWALKQVRKDASIPEQLDRLDKIGVALAVDNVLKGIIDGDKEYTLRLMDGRGLFRSHKSVQAEVRETVLQLQVVVDQPKFAAAAAAVPKSVGAGTTAPTTLSTLTGMVGSIDASLGALVTTETDR